MQDLSPIKTNKEFTTKENFTKKSVIYLVDDDMDDRLMGQSALEKSDHTLEIRPMKCADSLFECLENMGLYDSLSFAEYHSPVILLDIHMPRTSGIEALERIRNHPMTSEFPVILLTTDCSGQNVYEAYRLEANGYLEKPFNLAQFHKVMKQVNQGKANMKISQH